MPNPDISRNKAMRNCAKCAVLTYLVKILSAKIVGSNKSNYRKYVKRLFYNILSA